MWTPSRALAAGHPSLWKNRVVGDTDALEQRVADLADVVNRLVDVVSKLDDETSDTAAAAFDSDVPRVAGHKATAAELQSLRDTLAAWLNE